MVNDDGSIPGVSSQLEIQRLVEKIKKPADLLAPGLDSQEQRRDDDILWNSMKGIRGLWAMFFDSGILLAMARQMSGGGAEMGEEIKLARLLRVASIIAAIEGMFLACFPRLPIPRFMARFAVNQYCELCAHVRALMEWTCPDHLTARFDAVI